MDLEKRKEEIAEGIKKGAALQLQQEWEKSIDDNRDEEDGQKQNKRKVWEKQPKKKPKKGGKPTQKVIIVLIGFNFLFSPKRHHLKNKIYQ